MGQAAGLILGAVGAVVGGVLTGGAALAIEAGFLAGSLLGSILFPPKGPSPPDVRVQDSAYGKWIPRVYGSYRIAGNLIWLGTPHSHNSGGKGMGGKSGGPYTTLSFAVGLCDGPIQGVNRIWANGKLIYDVSNPADYQSLSGSASMVTGFTVYTGSETQNPDPLMQSVLGSANVPAYRGLAYVVFNELSLQQWGNYLPSFTFEVIAAPGTTSYNALQQTWYPYGSTTTAGFTLFGALKPSGATVFASNGPSGSPGLYVGNISAYGAATTAVYPTASPSIGLQQFQQFNTDVDVYPTPQGGGYYTPDGVFHACPGFANNPSWISGDGINGCCYQGNFYFCDSTAGTGGINKVSMTTGQTVALITGGQYTVLGCSPSYVWTLDSSGYTIRRWNINTLAAVDAWPATGFAIGWPGCVVSDDMAYINSVNGLRPLRPSQGGYQAPVGQLNTGNPAYSNCTCMAAVGDNMVIYGYTTYSLSYTTQKTILGFTAWTNTGSPVTTGFIVSDLLKRSGLQSAQYDTSQLTDIVKGFSVTGNSTTRSNLSPLMSTYFFDASDSDGLLRFVKRGGASMVSVPWDDMGASTSERDTSSQNPISQVIAQEFELPRSETITYMSASTDYQPGTQREQRMATSSNLDEATNVPIVLADNDAKVRVQAMLWERWTKRATFEWTLGLKYLVYEPCDVMTINDVSGEQYTLRITKVSYDGKGVLKFTGDPSVPSVYPANNAPSQGGVASGFKPTVLDYSGQTMLAIMDLPPLRNQDTNYGLYVAACGFAASWPGCLVDLSRDDVNFSQVMSIVNETPIGTATTTLGNYSGGNVPDELNQVTVQLFDSTQTLSSVAYSSFLQGAQAALIGSEIVFFRTATQVSAGVYTLSGLMRGRLGTEWAMGTHYVGDTFVFLNAQTISTLAIQATDIGSPMYFEPYLNNIYGSTPGSVTQVTPQNARVKPLAPAQCAAIHGSTAATTDITVQWSRRARVNWTWLDSADVPLDEPTETYTITASNSSGAVQFTQTVTGPFTSPTRPSAILTNATLTTYFGAAGSNQTINLSVQQNSSQGVLGYAATTSIAR